MIKTTWLILLLSISLQAFDSGTAAKIFEKIFVAMLHKESIQVYTGNEAYSKVIYLAPSLSVTGDFKAADIILVDDFDEIPQGSEGMLMFSTSYPVYKEVDDAVGAFYWDRGRIKIEFSKERLKAKKITLPDTFNKYVKNGS